LANGLYLPYYDKEMTETHLKSLLDRILAQEQLTAAFQPVVSLNQQNIFGYEGLIRGPADSLLYRPSVLLAVAAKYRRLADVDFLCRKIVIQQFAKLKLPGRLFININPLTLREDDFINRQTRHYLQKHDLTPDRVVVEITEAQPVDNVGLLQEVLAHYREMGFKVALDDLGTGFSGLKLWSELQPDFVKLDRHFIQGVDEDQNKRQFIKSIQEIARSLECETIAEGIETKSEYATLRKLGIQLAQGHYFDKPLASPNVCLNPELFSKRTVRARGAIDARAACLLRSIPSVARSASAKEAAELFGTDTKLHSIAVVERGKPVGLVIRSELMNRFDRPDDHALHNSKPIDAFMRQDVVVVDKRTPLEEVSRRLTNAQDRYTEEFIITDNGFFAGKGTLLDLLRKMTELRFKSAPNTNPLTLLPSDVLIRQALEENLSRTTEFSVAHYGLDHFKAYSDVYGHGRGEEIVQLLGRLLRETTDSEQDFIGHTGGDNFVVIYRSLDWMERCENLLYTFRSLIGDCYTPRDRQQGGIEVTDSLGVKRRFPIMTLAVGTLWVKPMHQHLSPEGIAKRATEALAMAQANPDQPVCVQIYDECPAETEEADPFGRTDVARSVSHHPVLAKAS
jgi:diguanylate cyclase (GGDEF)-like protein